MFVAVEWIEEHCVVPDGFRRGDRFRLYDGQLEYLSAFYLVRGDAVWDPDNPLKASAFVHRRGILVGPQKLGKNPMDAAHVCLEGVGPALFCGFAGRDDGYVCSDHGCGCGWEYAYDPGEPMGMTWPTPLIQITAFSADQTDNTYDALRPMIAGGPLADIIPAAGEEFIRLPGGGRIDTVTSSAQSRLGNPITFAIQDQVEQWWPSNGMTKVADTQYRNLAGMGGRASLTANAWDPTDRSVAQREFESTSTDVLRQMVVPPTDLDYADPVDRRRIHEIVYPSDVRRESGGHVDLDDIEAEAAAIAAHDLPQAKRYFGNVPVAGAGRAFDLARWGDVRVKRKKVIPDGALVVLSFDGSRRWDATALIATEVASGYQWPIRIWERPANAHDGWEVPADQVSAAVDQAFETWDVWRLYADPPYWEDTVAAWAGRHGKERVIEWWTSRPKAMALATRAWAEAMATRQVSHCADGPLCQHFTAHVGNAVKRETGYRDDGGVLWTIEKDRPGSPRKIDAAVAAIIGWEARNDAIASGALSLVDLESAYDETYVSPLAAPRKVPS